MKKRNLVLLAAALMTLSACGGKDAAAEKSAQPAEVQETEAAEAASEGTAEIQEEKAAEQEASEETSAEEGEKAPAAEENGAAEAGSSRYAAFLDGTEEVTIDGRGVRSQGLEFPGVFADGETYTLDGIITKTADYLTSEWANPGTEVEPEVAYADIDCGGDGAEELALCVTYPLSTEAWRQYMILKDTGEKLVLGYMGCAWSRTGIAIDRNGFIADDGSNGAASHNFEKSFVDKDGRWNFLYGVETEIAPENLYWKGEFHDLSAYSLDMENFMVLKYYVSPEWSEDRETWLTYANFRESDDYSDTYGLFWTPDDDASLYDADNAYRKAFDAEGIEVTPLGEIEARIAEKEGNLNFTKEAYYSGEMVEWKPVSAKDLHVGYEEEMGQFLTGSEKEVVVNSGEGSTRLVFAADKPLKDFKILALEFEDFTEAGNISFKTEDACVYGELAPGEPLVAEIVFYGDMPNNGISFVDENGKEHRFAINVSGKDGSLGLMEF